MRRRVTAVAAGGLLLLPVIVALSRGGYFDAARLRAGIAACVLAAVAAVLGIRTTTAGKVALGGMAALTAWTALSLTWAPMGGPAIDDLERLVLYLAALVAAAGLLDTRATEPALLAGIAATAVYGLSERLLPGVFSLTRSAAAGDRLSQPLTYWNAQGALAAVGLVLAAGLVAGRCDRRLRIAAAATAPVLGLDLYLTLSRGALGAFAAGVLVLLALHPDRATLRAAILAAAAAAVPAIAAELVFRPVLRADSSAGAGAGMLVLLIATTIAAAILARPREPEPLSWLRPVAAIALAAALATTVVAAAHSGRNGAPEGSSRLTSVESNRYAYWRVALDTFADNPLKGVGSGGYRVEWLQRRHFAETVRDAHSLYLETAAELGLVGLLALGALFGGVAACVRGEAAAGAALAAWAVHAGVDWDWEMPGLTLVAILLAGAVIARAARRE